MKTVLMVCVPVNATELPSTGMFSSVWKYFIGRSDDKLPESDGASE